MENNYDDILDIDLDEFSSKNNYVAKFPKSKDFENSKMIPFCPVTLFNNSVDWEKMLEEVLKLRDCFVPHRTYDNHSGWESLCIHGLSSVHVGSNSSYGFENFNEYNKWTDVSFFTPTIKDFVQRLEFKKIARVRIMKLKAGGYIKVHRDGGYGLGAINVAINNPKNCNFYIDNVGILPFWSRENPEYPRLICPNTGNYHSVINRSNEDRYHIIIHAEGSLLWEKIKHDSLR